MLVVAVVIKFDSKGPVFYRVRRVGYRGRPLMMLKFRKMHDNATGGPLTAARDPRLTAWVASSRGRGSTSYHSCGMCSGDA